MQMIKRDIGEDGEEEGDKERWKEWLKDMERGRAEITLEPFHRHAVEVIRGLLAGYEKHIAVVEVIGKLAPNRRLKETILPPQEDLPHSVLAGDYKLPVYAKFLHVLRRHPFPFGRRERKGCGKFFVQPVRGKPRRYCSTACRLQSSPAVARHTAYVQELRQKRRKTEIAITQAILRQWSDQKEYLRELGKQFSQKSRRQLLN